MAIKAINPQVRIVGVEAAGSPGMKKSVEAGHVVTLDTVGPMIDGLVVRRVGEYNLEVVKSFVDDIILVDERKIFDAVVWTMERLKFVAEGAAVAPIAALMDGAPTLPTGSKVGCVLSGGNLDLAQLRGLSWN
jgi:threonine dehydratase